jgi:hypothetical protein
MNIILILLGWMAIGYLASMAYGAAMAIYEHRYRLQYLQPFKKGAELARKNHPFLCYWPTSLLVWPVGLYIMAKSVDDACGNR